MRIVFKKSTKKEYDIRYIRKFFWLPHYFDLHRTFIWLESANVVQKVLNGKWETINLQENEYIN